MTSYGQMLTNASARLEALRRAVEVLPGEGDFVKLRCACGWEKRTVTGNVDMHRAMHSCAFTRWEQTEEEGARIVSIPAVLLRPGDEIEIIGRPGERVSFASTGHVRVLPGLEKRWTQIHGVEFDLFVPGVLVFCGDGSRMRARPGRLIRRRLA